MRARRFCWLLLIGERQPFLDARIGDRSGPARLRRPCAVVLKPAKLIVRCRISLCALLRGGPLCDVNPVQLGRVISDGLYRLAEALRSGQGLEQALAELAKELLKVRCRTARRKRKTAAQIAAQDLDDLVLETLG